MNDAHGRFGLVDVLAARSARLERLEPQIFGIDLDLDVFTRFDLRNDVDRGERRVAAVRGVKRRDAHEPVDAAFAFERAVRVAPAHEKRNRFQPGLFGRRFVDDVR